MLEEAPVNDEARLLECEAVSSLSFFFVYMGVDVVGTACEGSDNTVLGRCSISTGGLGVLVGIGVVWASDKQRSIYQGG